MKKILLVIVAMVMLSGCGTAYFRCDNETKKPLEINYVGGLGNQDFPVLASKSSELIHIGINPFLVTYTLTDRGIINYKQYLRTPEMRLFSDVVYVLRIWNENVEYYSNITQQSK